MPEIKENKFSSLRSIGYKINIYLLQNI